MACNLPKQAGQLISPTFSPMELFKKHLILLLHAQKCPTTERKHCILQDCKMYVQLIQHIRGCPSSNICLLKICKASREISAHWEVCTSSSCPVCEDLRRYRDKIDVSGTTGSPRPSINYDRLNKDCNRLSQDKNKWLINEDKLLLKVFFYFGWPLKLKIAHPPQWGLVTIYINPGSRLKRTPTDCKRRFKLLVKCLDEAKMKRLR